MMKILLFIYWAHSRQIYLFTVCQVEILWISLSRFFLIIYFLLSIRLKAWRSWYDWYLVLDSRTLFWNLSLKSFVKSFLVIFVLRYEFLNIKLGSFWILISKLGLQVLRSSYVPSVLRWHYRLTLCKRYFNLMILQLFKIFLFLIFTNAASTRPSHWFFIITDAKERKYVSFFWFFHLFYLVIHSRADAYSLKTMRIIFSRFLDLINWYTLHELALLNPRIIRHLLIGAYVEGLETYFPIVVHISWRNF